MSTEKVAHIVRKSYNNYLVIFPLHMRKTAILRNISIGSFVGLLMLTLLQPIFSIVNASSGVNEDLVEVSLLSPVNLASNNYSINTVGTVTSTKDLTLSFQVDGRVKDLYVEPGSFVEKGDLLAHLDNNQYESQLLQAELAYSDVYNSYLGQVSDYNEAYARSLLHGAEYELDALYDEYENQDASLTDIKIQREVVNQYIYNLQIVKIKGDSGTSWDLVQSAKESLNNLKATTDFAAIYAPFDGEVVSVFTQVGEYLAAGDSVGILLNRDDVEVETYLSVEDAKDISVGNTAVVNEEFIGEIVGISSRVDDYSQTLKVRIQLDDLEDLIIGEQVEVEIDRDVDDVTLVPLTSVAYDGTINSLVFFYYDGAVYQKEVNTGEVFDSYIEVYNLDNTSIVEDIGGLTSGQAVSLTL